MTIVLDKDRPSPSQVEGRVLVPLRRVQIMTMLAVARHGTTEQAADDFVLLDYARRNPELP